MDNRSYLHRHSLHCSHYHLHSSWTTRFLEEEQTGWNEWSLIFDWSSIQTTSNTVSTYQMSDSMVLRVGPFLPSPFLLSLPPSFPINSHYLRWTISLNGMDRRRIDSMQSREFHSVYDLMNVSEYWEWMEQVSIDLPSNTVSLPFQARPLLSKCSQGILFLMKDRLQ